MNNKHNKKLLEKYHEHRKEAFQFLGNKCAICESTYELEMDHKYRAKKTIAFGKDWYNKEKWWEEVKAQGQLLCRDCHRKKTNQELSILFKKDRSLCHGTVSQYYRYKCRCDKCKLAYSQYRKLQRQKKGETKGIYNRAVNHGEYLSYKRGCRCDLCRAANAKRARDSRQAKKDKKI